ncbi:hypothetical protein LYSIN_02308 [Lysinibacillus sphaericus]|uniref:Stage III sporulation protein AG n=1 Tax=Lysinibacillus sphaericus TaxID=1421 RepID=A0A2S5D362_LYSSH|nr:hypothetical protein [Lysinibacillus sphaericus]POZ57524.1 hypothetical protein LYSIN_02308 [Lysinibacillus sphaericus]
MLKRISKKTILFSLLLVMMIAVSYYLMGQQKPKPEVTSELTEFLPNGEKKVRVMEEVDEETTQWRRAKEADIQSLIAEQTGLKGEDVLVSATSESSIGDTENQEITCSVVLRTESTFDDQIIQNVVDGIIHVFKQDSKEANISKENIVFANNTDVLY